MKYRDTTAKNIYSNLQMEENSRFVFYKGLCIGLKSKKYNQEKYTKVKENQPVRKTWDESFLLLEEFLTRNERFPNSKGDENEQKLYSFFNIQYNKANSGKIDEFKTQKVLSIANLYNYRKRARHSIKNVKHTYDELKLFISEHRRLPKAETEEESSLYHFYYRQTTLFTAGHLSNEQYDKYLEINNLIQLFK